MKTRMDRYHNKTLSTLKREKRNSFLYDEIYEYKRESESNITLSDNAREIDINQIKELLDDRENYKRKRAYKEIIGDTKKEIINEINYKEPDEKDYDINEIIKKKKEGIDIIDDKIRKISNTQYDILKGLSLRDLEYELKNEPKYLTRTKSYEEEKTIDLFDNLKGDGTEELTPKLEEAKIDAKKSTFNTFEFDKKDFEDLNKEKLGLPFALKIMLIFLGSILLVSLIFFLLSKFMGS